MRASLLLVAASSCLAGASLVKLAGDVEPFNAHFPRETGSSKVDEKKGWTPKPTPAPGAWSRAEEVLKCLVRRDDADDKKTATTDWENDETCGWYSGTSSRAWTCASSSTCATNKQNVVACVSGTFSPFFTVCLDYNAYKKGACNSIGAATGCWQVLFLLLRLLFGKLSANQQSTAGACGTFLWSGSPARSMYRCFNKPVIISMNDQPQFVLDAQSRSNGAPDTTSSTGTTTSTQPTETGDLGNTKGGGGDDNKGGNGSNTGAIVGGVVGGVGGAAILGAVAAFLVLRHKKKKKEADYSAVNPQDPSGAGGYGNYGAGPGSAMTSPGFVPGQPSPQMSTTYPPQSPYGVGAAQNDPRQSYYNPAAQQGGHLSPGLQQQHQQQQQMYGGSYAPSSQGGSPDPNKMVHGGGGGGSYMTHQSFAPSAELPATPAQAAPNPHNPVEMGPENYR